MDATMSEAAGFDSTPADNDATTSRASVLLFGLWFGMLSGGLELALVLLQDVASSHISMDVLRRNRHYVWMIPLSNVAIFALVSLAIAAVARVRPRVARWLMWRLFAAMTAIGLLLNVEGLYPAAGAMLALGIATMAARVLEPRTKRVHEIVRVSLPVLAGGLVTLTLLWYGRVTCAEQRALASLPTAQPGAPNVLLIVLDDVRASSMSLYGRTRPTTPNLERLARQGVLFAEARPTASWTLPSHASMFTGQWPHAMSVGWDRPLDAAFPTLAEKLAGSGYATAGFVANTYYGNALYGLGRGFARYQDNYENESVSLFELIRSSAVGRRILQGLGHSIHVAQGGTAVRKSAAMINRDILGWLDRQREDRPFFIFANYYDAHGPFVAPEGEGPSFGLAARPAGERVEILKRHHRLETGKHREEDGSAEKIQQEATALWRDSYESCIAYLDRQLGMLFDELDRRGILDETLVIVTSDHGEHLKERGFCGHGLSLYREEVHVPLIIIPPSEAPAGTVVSAPVSLRDIPATALDLIRAPGVSPFPGRSLARFWQEGSEGASTSDVVLCELDHQKAHAPALNVPASLGPLKSIVAHGKVYIWNGNGREELYDLASDRAETNNLIDAASEHASVARFRNTLDRALKDSEVQAIADRRRQP